MKQQEIDNFISITRKINWEAEYEKGEHTIGENQVRKIIESLSGKLEDQTISANLLKTNLQSTLAERDKLKALNSELVEALEGLSDMLKNHIGDDDDETELINVAFEVMAKAKSKD